jgi:hypothetical protein
LYEKASKHMFDRPQNAQIVYDIWHGDDVALLVRG